MQETKINIIELLKQYPAKKIKIEQLRFELEHPALIWEEELIENLSLGNHARGDGVQHSGHISDKTMTIAMRYQDIRKEMNSETVSAIMSELRLLESEVMRLEYYISTLHEKKANVIRSYYFYGKLWDELVLEMHLSKRALVNYRDEAVKELASMYSYITDVKCKKTGCSNDKS